MPRECVDLGSKTVGLHPEAEDPWLQHESRFRGYSVTGARRLDKRPILDPLKAWS